MSVFRIIYSKEVNKFLCSTTHKIVGIALKCFLVFVSIGMRCIICDSFHGGCLRSLLRHINQVHSTNPVFNCICPITGCFRRFRVYDTLYRHIKKDHKDIYNNKVTINNNEPLEINDNVAAGDDGGDDDDDDDNINNEPQCISSDEGGHEPIISDDESGSICVSNIICS